jgi:DNA polymerase epsilon subunit 1
MDELDDTLTFALEVEGGLKKSNVANYDDIKNDIMNKLMQLRDNPNRKECPSIFHLDVGAMYPNIILTNRLQPSAIVNEEICASCEFNRPENNW